MDIRQSSIDPVVPHREPFVINSQQVQDGGMNVIDLGGVISIERFVPPSVRRSMRDARFDAAASQPIGKHVRIVISALATLGTWHPTKFGRPQDDRIFQQPALLEIPEEGRDGLVDLSGHGPVPFLKITVLVPRVGRAPGHHPATAILHHLCPASLPGGVV